MHSRNSPTGSAIRAVVALLADDDPNIVRVCRRTLLEWGPTPRAELERAATDADPRLRVRARDVLRSIQLREWAKELARLGRIAGPSAARRPHLLEDGLLRIAELGREHVVRRAELSASLDELGAELRGFVDGRSTRTAARHLERLLALRHGFTGCRQRYYASENAFLDRVLEQRRGLPEALAAIYLLVGRRAGLEMTAVRLPDYFLVRVHGPRRVLVDPFHGGRTVTRADCLRLLRDLGAGPEFARLGDADDVDLLVGLLDSLVRIHDRTQDGEFRSAIQLARRALFQSCRTASTA